MTTLTVEIEKKQDLTALQATLNKLGLKYTVDTGRDNTLSDAEMEGIKAGLADIENGRVHTHAEVKARIDQKLQDFRNR